MPVRAKSRPYEAACTSNAREFFSFSPPEHRFQPRIERTTRRHDHAAQRPRRDEQILDDARAAAEMLLADVLTKGPRHAVGESIRLAAARHDLRDDLEDQGAEN